MTGARHLYVHLPFCAHRCGYCDFVTVVGHGERARPLRRRAARRARARARAARAAARDDLPRRRHADASPSAPRSSGCSRRCPTRDEVTVEANPETVDVPSSRRCFAAAGVNRVSLGAQSFHMQLLRRAGARARSPHDVRRAFHVLRDAGFDNISLDLIYGIPGQSAADLERDLAEALALEPEHVSAYELEAKPGTRFTHAHGAELERQAEAMESYFELVVETLTGGRLPLVRDGELLPRARARRRARPARAAQPRLLARPRLPRARRRRGQHDRRTALAERALAPRLHRGARGGRAAAARGRGAAADDRATPSA